MVQRLCGICPVSHHLAAPRRWTYRRCPKPSDADGREKIRRLMHYGQILQSHALHFFHLCSPDLLFGFDSDVGRRNIVGVAEQHPETARRGVLIRKFGQEAIRITAASASTARGDPGGVNKSLSLEERDYLLKDAYQIVGWCRDAVHLARELHETDPALYNSFGIFRSHTMSLVGPDGAMDLLRRPLRAATTRAASRRQRRGRLREADPGRGQAVERMKFPSSRALGNEQGWYKVGPLARVQNCDSIRRRSPTPSAANSSTTPAARRCMRRWATTGRA